SRSESLEGRRRDGKKEDAHENDVERRDRAHSPFARISELRIIRAKTLQAAWRLERNPCPARGLSAQCGHPFPQRAKRKTPAVARRGFKTDAKKRSSLSSGLSKPRPECRRARRRNRPNRTVRRLPFLRRFRAP